jgi:hypothetical protein
MPAIDPQETFTGANHSPPAARLRRSRTRRRFAARTAAPAAAAGVAAAACVATAAYALAGGIAPPAPRTPARSYPSTMASHHLPAVQHHSTGDATAPAAKPPAPAPAVEPLTVPLVNATGLNPGFWFAKVPSGWAHTDCGQEKPGVAMPSTCSYWAEGLNVDVWSNPTGPMERVTVTTCFYGGCGEGQVKSAARPKVAPWFPVLSTFRMSAYEIGYAGMAEGQPGQFSDDGVIEAAHMGAELAFPLVTLTTQLPPAQHSLATAILDSLIVEPPLHCGGK